MRHSESQLYLHLIWGTWDRLPLVTPDLEAPLFAALANRCRALQCVPLAIGGVSDHLHLLVRLHPTVAVATLVKELKGSSSHLVTHRLAPGRFFQWQGSYGAITLGPDDVPVVTRYVAGQKEHHQLGTLRPAWEQIPRSAGDEPIEPDRCGGPARGRHRATVEGIDGV